MQVYLVGGAVRDRLLNSEIKDRDWVVVGSNAQEMLQLGYTSVGKDFPVFLHPVSHEEYALARTERKTAVGYHGFEFSTDSSVTLEQDLSRRDLTINAMAMDEHEHLIDPYGGRKDLQNGILRHVSPAFAEDPVRILRVARFAARFNFAVAPETLQLMQQMVTNGEVDALVAERIWQELSRALQEPYPQRFFAVLNDCGAFEKILPEIAALQGNAPKWAQTLSYLQTAAHQQTSISTAYSLMCVHVPAALLPLHQRLRAPKECMDAADILQDAFEALLYQPDLKAEAMLQVFQRCDVWRRPERWQQLWNSCELMAKSTHAPLPNLLWQRALEACLNLNVAYIVAHTPEKYLIAQNIQQARLCAINHCLTNA